MVIEFASYPADWTLSDWIEINWPFVPTAVWASACGLDEFSVAFPQPVNRLTERSIANRFFILRE